MDLFDRATELEERQREDAIAHARSVLTGRESAMFCESEACGEPIPETRRQAVPGCRFCIECQNLHERALKRRDYAIHA